MEAKTEHCRKFSAFVLVITLICASPALSYDFAGGTGEPNDPYQIETAEQLLSIGSDPNLLDKCYILMNDIDLDPNVTGILPFTQALIAPDTNNLEGNFQGTPFSGVFDGKDHIISNLVILAPDKSYIGLFGFIDGGQVKNLSFTNAYITGSVLVGILSGFNNEGTILSCRTTGKITGELCTGGLLGGSDEGVVKLCSSDCESVGDYWTGGLIGLHVYNIVDRCCSKGLTLGNDSVGGLIGSSNISSVVSNCYADISVYGYRGVGGLIGVNHDSMIVNSYSKGFVSGDEYVGGFIGHNGFSYCESCFWDIETSGTTDGVGNVEPDPNEVQGKTTEEMQKAATFIDDNWDFENIWAICEGTNYPKLQWQIPLADLLCPDGVSFLDFAFFADYWLEIGCADSNNCDDADFDLSGIVDPNDLNIFTEQWLTGF